MKMDRRVQRTRQLLNNALMSLIVEQGYDSITVQNIIDRANLGRSTFYAHYQDKEDLLLSRTEEIVHSLIWGLDNIRKIDMWTGENRRIMDTRPIFHHAQEQYDLHRAIVGGRGIDVVIETIRDHLTSHIQEQIELLVSNEQSPAVPTDVMSIYLAGTLLTLLNWWLDNEMPHSPKRMDEIFQELTMNGVWAVLDLNL